MSQWDSVRRSFRRAHSDLFDRQARYEAEFINISQGTWDPDNDEMTGETENTIGTEDVEIVPPAQDTSIDLQGTDVDWSTSIRFPQDDSIVGSLKPLGVDDEQPTKVEITDQQSGDIERFQLHSYTTEIGSGLIMCRLQEE